ncbi:MAG: glycosyltransferase family 39 protein [Elusimicrobiota bacterium]|jgi:4-amino-4-deoxy-L-arabinose transferase-like glycosyltransferase|nr:glycosyltransferase family 39 protein [Elusimicrobiota bacterium]
MTKLFNKLNAIIIVFVLLVWKIFLSAKLELHPDEAYYWLWSKRLDFGYFDHSPMVAYFIKLTTLWSDSELAIRFSLVFAMIILSVLLWKFSKAMFNDERMASASVIILNTMPIMLLGSIIITPDSPAFLFYSFTVYFLWKFIKTNSVKDCYLTGIFFGLALLSKYTVVLFLPCLLIYMILDKKLFWFKNPHFYLSGIISFIFFLPVIIWNYLHDWISFIFQLGHGATRSQFHFNFPFEFLGAQCLTVGPIIFIGGLFASFAYLFSRDSKKIFLACFCLPIIIFFMLTGLRTYPEANWPTFSFMIFALAAAHFFLSGKNWKKILLVIGIVINMLGALLIGVHAKYSILPLYKLSERLAVTDATNWFFGWGDLAELLMQENYKYIDTRQHQWSAAIEYYSRGQIKSYVSSDRKNQYQFWWVEAPSDYETSKAAKVLVDWEMEDDFSTITNAQVYVIKRNGIAIRQYAVIDYGHRDPKEIVKKAKKTKKSKPKKINKTQKANK